MKTLYLSCEMGAAGDMLMAALYELLPEKERFLEIMNHLLPDVTVTAEESVKCGVKGTHMRVTVRGMEEKVHDHDLAQAHHDHDRIHDHEHTHEHEHHHDHEHEHHHEHHHEHEHHHAHSSLGDVTAIIDGLPLPGAVRENAKTVYASIAKAESEVHGMPVNEVHFHEVGALDAVVDVAGVCLAMELLKPGKVLASPVHVGSGMVKCAHGLLPVPAPATAKLLSGIPIYSGSIRGELCTPTGAALLKHFVTSFGPMPVMTLEKTGFGMGMKDFEACNAVRALWGETEAAGDAVLELKCNLDDMTGESIGFAMEQLLEAGALDVFTQPIGMKKSRPAILLTVLCRVSDRDTMLRCLFQHTSTLGVRETDCRRSTLTRREEIAETPLGPVRVKVSEGWGVTRRKAEYEDLATIARERGMALEDVRKYIPETE